MKKLYTIFLVLSTPVILLLMANSTGSPGGRTGSPGDNGNTCTGCHTGTASTISGWITTNVPPQGYTPGQTYTITATGTHSGVVKFGFELTVENSLGVKAGTLQLAEPTRTKFINNNKAVTHTAAGNVPTGNTNTWTVNWVAPAGVSGNVGIYAAFNAANGNGNTGGDVIYKSSTFISEFTPPPVLVSISPDQAEQGDAFQATITGSNTNFAGTPTVSLRYSGNPLEVINGTNVVVISPTVIQAQFSIPVSTSAGLWNVHASNLVLMDGFTVIPALVPALTGITPDNGEQGVMVMTTITAENTTFEEAAPVVSLSLHDNPAETIQASGVTVVNNTTLQASFDIPMDATPGMWDLNVDDLMLFSAFTVNLATGLADNCPNMLRIYPNPASQRFFIDNAAGSVMYFYRTNGELVKEMQVINENQDINISGLSRGLYVIKLEQNGVVRVEKIVVN